MRPPSRSTKIIQLSVAAVALVVAVVILATGNSVAYLGPLIVGSVSLATVLTLAPGQRD